MDEKTDGDRRDARTVEITLALTLGVLTFLGLVLAGWLLGHLVDLAAVGPGLATAAGVVALAVVVGQLLRSRSRGL